MSHQRTLFDDQREIGHTDPELPEEAKPRLGGQNGTILARLRNGPATNLELEEISGSRRINSRIADVRRYLRRHEQQTIECEAIDTSAGIYRYEIRCTSHVGNQMNQPRG